MQQTEHLKLNLIETGDPMSPAPLNANAQALDALVAGIAAEQHLFKLTEAAVTVDNSPLVLDLSGVDVTQYGGLLLVFHLKHYGGFQYVRINDSKTMCVLEGSTTQNTPNYLDGMGMVLFLPFGDSVVGMCHCHGEFIGLNSGKERSAGGRFEVPWAEIQTIGLTANASAGSGEVLYGIRF